MCDANSQYNYRARVSGAAQRSQLKVHVKHGYLLLPDELVCVFQTFADLLGLLNTKFRQNSTKKQKNKLLRGQNRTARLFLTDEDKKKKTYRQAFSQMSAVTRSLNPT